MNKLKILIGFLFIGTAATAQTKFAGTWAQKGDAEFISGQHYANAVPKKVKLTSQKDSLAFEVISVAQSGDDTARYTLATNGGAFSDISKSKRKYTKKIEWSADKKTMTITSVYKAAGSDTEVETTRIEIWKLSEDGKQLTINRKSVETKGEGWEAKGTYEKQ